MSYSLLNTRFLTGLRESSVGRRFALLCALPLVLVAVGAGVYVDYRDAREMIHAQEQRAETHGRLLGLNASLFLLTDYADRFLGELDSIAVKETELAHCRVLDTKGEVKLDWNPPSNNQQPSQTDIYTSTSPLSFDGESLGSIEISFSMDRIHGELAARRLSLIKWDLAIVLGIGILCFREGRRLSSSIREVLTSMEGIARGNFQLKAKEGNDEIGRLGVAFNRMTERLQKSNARREKTHLEAVESQRELEVAYVQLKTDTAHRKQLETDLAQAQRLESIGHLAAGIAHEINTPTQYIGDNVHFLEDAMRDVVSMLRNYAGLVDCVEEGKSCVDSAKEAKRFADEHDLEFLLEEIPSAITQALEGNAQVASIVKAMKSFSHMGSGDAMAEADINDSIHSTIIVARSEWKHLAKMETSLDPNIPQIPCHSGEIKQVLLNLIVNAAHAIEDCGADQDNGTIRISTQELDEMLEIRISDSGIGIPVEMQPRIFDPFFTTKDVGRGTGQGLAMAHRVIVEEHAGTLSFETETGVGTTFIIQLPLSAEVVSPMETGESKAAG